ncbi:hypothetical protein CAAN1_15S00650 [[Candida] anglica]|uniref:BAG domain-containing protein n=1 Tax=[Candida] anglica TaxID=148631 RepID=A0ABP0EB91_9ASCO
MDQVEDWIRTAKSQVLPSVEQYFTVLKNATLNDLLEDVSHGKITPITVSLSVTAITTVIVLSKVFGSSGASTKSKKKKPKKKLTRAQKANKEIQGILDFVESEYVPQIDEYIADPTSFKKDDRAYRYKYFEEMLLKQLMKLDGVDVAGNDVLRDNRKKVIKFIQDHQKRLDVVKKEFKF